MLSFEKNSKARTAKFDSRRARAKFITGNIKNLKGLLLRLKIHKTVKCYHTLGISRLGHLNYIFLVKLLV